LVLTVTPEPATVVTPINICSDEDYTWAVNGVTYLGSAGDITVDIEGDDCAADQRLVLTVTPEPAIVVTKIDICSDEEYTWAVNGVTYLGSAGDITVDIEGDDCAADQRLVLTVTPEPATVVTPINICSDEDYTWAVNGVTYLGSAGDITVDIEGDDCAADQRLVLTVTPEPATVVTTVNICSDEEYTWDVNGVTYNTDQDITIEGEDCTADQRLVLYVNPELIINTSPQDALCFGESSGSIDLTVSGGSGDYTYLWTGPDNFTATTEDLSDLAVGNYSVTVTDSLGCFVTQSSISIDSPRILQILRLSEIHVLCNGEATGSIEVTVYGGVPDYEYVWTGPDGFTVNDTLEITDLIAGEYRIIATDANGCTTSRSYTIREPEELTCSVEIDNESSECQDDVTATVSVTGGESPYTYLWDNGETTVTAFNLSPGEEHEVEVTDANQCVTLCVVAIPEPCDVRISVKAFLQGPLMNPATPGLMNDILREEGLLPTTSPYADALVLDDVNVFNTGGVSGTGSDNDNIVDWVWIELRDSSDNTNIIVGRSALLQRDGDVVDINGVSDFSIDVPSDNYYIVIKHRNHLGTMSANAIALSYTPAIVDFTDSAFVTFGSDAQATSSWGDKMLCAGNVNGDTSIQYTGSAPENADLLAAVLNNPANFLNLPTFPMSNVYSDFDVDMNGSVLYLGGSAPDITPILQNVLDYPGNFLGLPTWAIFERLPENSATSRAANSRSRQ
jgi:hypothetical protein